MAEQLKAQVEPTEPGWYAYDGGAQSMIFLLRSAEQSVGNRRQWFVILDNGGMDECEWGYIEQATGVYPLVPLVPQSGAHDNADTLEPREGFKSQPAVEGSRGPEGERLTRYDCAVEGHVMPGTWSPFNRSEKYRVCVIPSCGFIQKRKVNA